MTAQDFLVLINGSVQIALNNTEILKVLLFLFAQTAHIDVLFFQFLYPASHQKILSSHYDLKALYTRELEALSQMSLIRRFSMRNDFYDKVLENPSALGNLDYFLRPLFNREPDKVYNLNKALLYQKPSSILYTSILPIFLSENLSSESWSSISLS